MKKNNSISMQYKAYTLLVCVICLFLVACDKHKNAPSPTTVSKTTVIGLILGDNSLNDFVSSDISEMCIGLEDVDLNKNNLVLYVDNRGSNSPSILSFKQSTQDHSKVVTDTIYRYSEKESSADPKVLKDVLSRIITKYPAESYAMILWSHGQGWLPTPSTEVENYISTKYFGQDTTGGGQEWMNISDLEDVIAYGQNLLGGNKKFDYLYFDACFMGNIETAYQLRKTSNYYIASVAETPGPGGNYETLVPIMFNANTDRAKKIAEAYDLAYNDPEGYPGWTYGAQISVYDNSKMDALANACQTTFSNIGIAQAIQGVNLYASDIQHFDRISFPAYFDFEQIMEKALTSSEYSPLETALDNVVVYNARPASVYSVNGGSFSMDVNCGLAAYFPQYSTYSTVQRYNNYFATYDWAQNTQMTSWYPLVNYK